MDFYLSLSEYSRLTVSYIKKAKQMEETYKLCEGKKNKKKKRKQRSGKKKTVFQPFLILFSCCKTLLHSRPFNYDGTSMSIQL